MDFTEAVRLAKAGNEAGYRYLYDATYKKQILSGAPVYEK